MNQVLYLNGRYMPLEDGRIAVNDRGFQFADGIYEVIRVYRGAPFVMREHLERMISGLRKIDMTPPHTVAELEGICGEILRRCGESECGIYLQITRGAAARNHKYPTEGTPATVVAYNTRVNYFEEPERRRGMKILSHPDIRWKLCDIKSIALLPNVMLKNRAIRQGVFEMLLHDEKGLVSEGSVCNAYCIKDGTIHTAPNGPSLLPGITKHVVLQEARAMGLPVVEVARTVDFFKQADEVFLTSTTMEVMPVVAIDGQTIGAGAAGAITWRLHEAYQRRIMRDCGAAAAAALQ